MHDELSQQTLRSLGISTQQIANLKAIEKAQWGDSNQSQERIKTNPIIKQTNLKNQIKSPLVKQREVMRTTETIHDLPPQMLSQQFLRQQQEAYGKFSSNHHNQSKSESKGLQHYLSLNNLSLGKNKSEVQKFNIKKSIQKEQQKTTRHLLPGQFASNRPIPNKNHDKITKSLKQSFDNIFGQKFEAFQSVDYDQRRYIQQSVSNEISDDNFQPIHHQLFPHFLQQQEQQPSKIQDPLIGSLLHPDFVLKKSYAKFRQTLYQVENLIHDQLNFDFIMQRNIAKTMIIVDNSGALKMEIYVSQIANIFTNQSSKTMLFIFDQIPKFYRGNLRPISRKKPITQWDRMNNPYLQNQLYCEQIALASIFHKKFAFQFETGLPFRQVLTKIEKKIHKEKIVQISEIKNIFSFNKFQSLFKQYRMQKFLQYFRLYNWKDQIKSEEIQFSLLSLLYKCHQIELDEIFQLAQFISKIFDQKNVKNIWQVAINFTSQSIQGDLKKRKKLISIFQSKLKNKKQSRELSQKIIQVPTFKITPSGMIPSGWSKDLRNRLVRYYKQYDFQFMKIEVTDDDPLKSKSKLYQCKDIIRQSLQKKLQKIKFLNRIYIPLGWTQSQLKTSSMWYTLESHNKKIIQRQELLNFLGDFKQFNDNPALKAARIGQNLSTGLSVDVSGVKNYLQQDETSGRLLFTDGIGCMSIDIVQKIQMKLQTKATIFQVRYQGAKGMLTINRQLPPNTIMIRKSMKKFQCPNKEALKYLDILDQNYYKPGFLNRQIITLLQSNQVPIQNLLKIQHQYITDSINFKHLFDNNDGINSFKQQCFSKNQGIFEIQSLGEIMQKINKQKPLLLLNEATLRGTITQKNIQMFEKLIKKTHIKVEKSARILGIIDEYSILNEGQIYCEIVKKDGERFNVKGRAMLTRNPCMHPADIRIVNCISKQEAAKRFTEILDVQNYFRDLTNCIIFPKTGKIPLTAQISGSDLDGDTFFITWDERLIPPRHRDPFVLDTIYMQKRVWDGTSYDQMIKFFCQFIFNNQLGRLANCHLAKADYFGADYQQCIELCRQHSKAVDYPKKGYKFKFEKKYHTDKFPHFMQKERQRTYKSKKSIGILYDVAKTSFRLFLNTMEQAKCEVYSLDKFYAYNYTDAQIKQACETVINFKNDIQTLLRIYGFQRQFQIYNYRVSERNKQSRDRSSAIKNMQLKYFYRFFNSIDIADPTNYYQMLRRNTIPIQSLIERKLILWYQISNTLIQKKNIKNSDAKLRTWHNRLQNVSGIRINQLTVIGLPWFCVPYLTYHIVSKN